MFTAYVDNIGCIGSYATKTAAIRAIRETVRNSGRAEPHGFVEDSKGNIIAEIGRQHNHNNKEQERSKISSRKPTKS